MTALLLASILAMPASSAAIARASTQLRGSATSFEEHVLPNHMMRRTIEGYEEKEEQEAMPADHVAALMQFAIQQSSKPVCIHLLVSLLAFFCFINPIVAIALLLNGNVKEMRMWTFVGFLVCCGTLYYLWSERLVHTFMNGVFNQKTMSSTCFFVVLYNILFCVYLVYPACVSLYSLMFVDIPTFDGPAIRSILWSALFSQDTDTDEDIRNKAKRQAREEFDEMSKELAAEMNTYYVSKEFKDKCDQLFLEADTDSEGALDLCKLRGPALGKLTRGVTEDAGCFFALAFDKNGNTKIEQDGFYELMQYFDMRQRKLRKLIASMKLIDKDGSTCGAEALNDKVLGLYFSAHWCPPCRACTSSLASSYTKDLKAKGLEVVFLSSDTDAFAFKEYLAQMPWLALEYDDRKLKRQLSEHFKVEGIPSFIIIDKDGSTITMNGRGAVSADPTGDQFPWHLNPA